MTASVIIFDLDGTILDDEKVYSRAFSAVLKTLGVEKTDELPHEGGIGLEANWKHLIAKNKIKTDKSLEELSFLTQKEFLKNLHLVELTRGFDEFADALEEKNLKIALATSNDWIVVEKILAEFGLEEFFDCIVTAEEVANKKPDPEIFITAAQKLGVESVDCIVFEDSKAGVTAAREAGMKVVGIAKDDEGLDADLVVGDFEEALGKLDDILNL